MFHVLNIFIFLFSVFIDNKKVGNIKGRKYISDHLLSYDMATFSMYSCHLFLISSASVRSIPFLSFIEPVGSQSRTWLSDWTELNWTDANLCCDTCTSIVSSNLCPAFLGNLHFRVNWEIFYPCMIILWIWTNNRLCSFHSY